MNNANVSGLHREAAYKGLESSQIKVAQRLNELAVTLQNESRYVGEIGDHIVYLKYDVACCFEAEKVMSHYSVSAMVQRKSITKELNGLLTLITGNEPSLSLITDASRCFLSKLHKHITQSQLSQRPLT
jgi:hypothetical protein